jgi:N-acetylmuramoyl-L-alanine amidase
MRRRVSDIFIHHSVTTPTNDPAADARSLDRIGRQRFGRFSYSYVIHPSGVVLEGAGDTVGAHTSGHNSTSLGICFIGNFENQDPTDAALDACNDLIRVLKFGGLVAPRPKVRAHRAVKTTACPGGRLNALVPCIHNFAQESGAGTPAPAPAPPPKDPADQFLRDLAVALREARKVTLRRGSKGRHVSALQLVLNGKGARGLVADGDFGPSTEAVVKYFQALHGLRNDGVVGPRTWEALLR